MGVKFWSNLKDILIPVSTFTALLVTAKDALLTHALEIMEDVIIDASSTFPLPDCIARFNVGAFASKVEDGFVKPLTDIEHGVSRNNVAVAIVNVTFK